MEEIWKDIKGYEGYYQVSNLGRIKSIERIVFLCDGRKRLHTERIIRLNLNTHGYPSCNLAKKGVNNRKSIHRLIAIAFIPNPENKPHINHKNGVKDDNSIENLEWVTAKENIIHAYKTGLNKPNPVIGVDNHLSKLTENQVREIKYRHKGLLQKEIAEIYGVNQRTISAIRTGISWAHISK